MLAQSQYRDSVQHANPDHALNAFRHFQQNAGERADRSRLNNTLRKRDQQAVTDVGTPLPVETRLKKTSLPRMLVRPERQPQSQLLLNNRLETRVDQFALTTVDLDLLAVHINHDWRGIPRHGTKPVWAPLSDDNTTVSPGLNNRNNG